jgi:hypothetical protein
MTQPVDLLFERTPLELPADLVFGDDASSAADSTAAISGSLPALTLTASVGVFVTATVAGSMPGLTFGVAATYQSNTSRPTVGRSAAPYERAESVQAGRTTGYERTDRTLSGTKVLNDPAKPAHIAYRALHKLGQGSRSSALSRHQPAARVAAWDRGAPFQQAARRHDATRSGHAEASHVDHARSSLFEDGNRLQRASRSATYQEAVALHREIVGYHQRAARGSKLWVGPWGEAVPTNGGPYIPPVVPPDPGLCYTPSPHLVFSAPWSADSALLFLCENHPDPENPDPDPDPEQPPATVVVPIRSVYIVINDVILTRVSNNLALPTLSLSLSIDADSWTWGFSATLPASALDDVMPNASSPVELEASINGNRYRLIAESVSRERSFGQSQIRIAGRGRNAVLAAPYAPVLSFANNQQRSAQQLMADVLTINGVPLGWDIDWGPEDWLVPADAFAMQGAYMDALNSIAGAAGAYIQPHPTDQTLRVLLRYPVAPWGWAAATPDMELPSAVMVRESIEWVDKPEYNRVFLTGTSQGVLAQVTRAGTAGNLVAPLVTDPLMTASEAARQRGIAVLSDTGRQATVRLSLPVLPQTGVITPGKLVRYVDGATTRLGLVRAVGVEASDGGANVRQTISLESHS